MTKPTKWHVHPAKAQIGLGIRPVWSESLLSAWRSLGSLAIHKAHSEDSDQTGWMPRLIGVFAGCTLILLVLSWAGSYDHMTCVRCSRYNLLYNCLPQFTRTGPFLITSVAIPKDVVMYINNKRMKMLDYLKNKHDLISYAVYRKPEVLVQVWNWKKTKLLHHSHYSLMTFIPS